jgi:hypothetical protein
MNKYSKLQAFLHKIAKTLGVLKGVREFKEVIARSARREVKAICFVI